MCRCGGRKAEHRLQRPRTPIIATTANVGKGEAGHCLAQGMDAFVGKPVRIAQLSVMLRHWLPQAVFPAADDAPHNEPANAPEAVDDALFTPEALVDAAMLREVVGSDPTLANNLLMDFLVATRKDLVALEAALAADEMPEAIRQAHRIKGAVALVGTRDVRTAAADAEAAGRAEDRATLASAQHTPAGALDLLAVRVER